MALLKNTKSNKTLNEKQWKEWNRTIFSLFWKIWLLTLLVELLLFFFYSPTPECSKSYYFYLFIVRPSGLELLVLVFFELAFTRLFQSHSRRVVSTYTILLISLFAGITVCVHTSVGMLPAMLLPHDKPKVVAEKIRADFAAFTFQTSLGAAHFTLSLGAAVYDRPRASASALFEEADNALYQAKRNGKNCVMVHKNET